MLNVMANHYEVMQGNRGASKLSFSGKPPVFVERSKKVSALAGLEFPLIPANYEARLDGPFPSDNILATVRVGKLIEDVSPESLLEGVSKRVKLFEQDSSGQSTGREMYGDLVPSPNGGKSPIEVKTYGELTLKDAQRIRVNHTLDGLQTALKKAYSGGEEIHPATPVYLVYFKLDA